MRPKECFVRRPVPQKLSTVEGEVIAKIKTWRATPEDEFHQELLRYPARVMQHFILLYHGHVKFRFRPIANELGIEMRTLERAFVEEFGKSMFQSQVDARLAFAQTLLRWMPPPKISVVANMLGYDEPRDFHHFFEKHTGETPSAWGHKEREKAKREVRFAAGSEEPF